MTSLNHKLPRYVKVGYGAAHMGFFSVEILIRFHLLIFYTKVVGLPADLAGYTMAMAIFWDAITDPLMGTLSDKTNTRFGKRRPYILAGGLALAACSILLFTPPTLSTNTGKFLFLLGSYILLNTCMTVIAVPHYALGGELTHDPKERTEVYGWLVLFSNLGSIVAVVLPGLALSQLGAESSQETKFQAYSLASIYIAGVVLFSAFVTFMVTSGYDRSEKKSTQFGVKDFFIATSSALKNPMFLPLFLSYVVGTLGLALNSATAFFFYEFRLELAKNQIHYIIGLYLVTLCMSIVAWVYLSGKYGKKWPAFWGGLILGILTTVSYPFMVPQDMLFPLIIAFLGGFMSGTIVLLYSLVTDIVDYDEFKTGQKREGLYFGLWDMGTKVARGIAFAVAGLMLSFIGFDSKLKQQPPEFAENLRWVFGPGVGLFIILAAIIFLWMPMTAEKHQRIQKILKWRKSKELARLENENENDGAS